MIAPLKRSQVKDLSNERMPALWSRRMPTQGGGVEVPGPGLWRTGAAGEFRRAMIAGIDAAREVVLVSSFLLTDTLLADAVLRAAARGVRVYILTASEQSIAKATDEEDRRVEEHKKLLASLVGKTLLRSAEHFHAKFVVVDPFIAAPARARGFLSTANFNKALTDGVELGLELDAGQAAALGGAFAAAFWNEAERELVEADRLGTVAKPPGQPRVPVHPGVYTTNKSSTQLREAVLGLIRGARRELVVASYGLDAAHPSVVELRAAAERGVAVTVLTRPRPAVLAGAKFLTEGGVVVRAHDKLHAKAVLADGVGLVMTANLEAQGLDRGFEVGVRADGAARILAATLAEWTESFPWEFRANPKRQEVLGEVWLGDRGARDPRVTVVEREAVVLPAVVAGDALAMEAAPPPDQPLPVGKDRVPCRVEYGWEVRPPVLPNEAKEKLRVLRREVPGKEGKPTVEEQRVPYEPPVYEHKGATYVKLRSMADADAARRLAGELKGVVVV